MAIPTHDISCITKAFKKSCPSCLAEVWFFSCTCGSKIYFKELGYPWEQHICRKYYLEQQIRLIQTIDRLSDSEVYAIISKIEKEHNRVLNEETEAMLNDILGKRKFDLSIIEFIPKTDTEFSGKIMHLNNPVNIFKKLGYDAKNEISIKLLGPIAKQQWAQIVVRSNPNKRNECYEYTIYVELDYLKQNTILQGSSVAGLLKVINHPKGKFSQLYFHKII